MMNLHWIALLGFLVMVPYMTACHAAQEPEAPTSYAQISQAEAWSIIQSGADVIILDAREAYEYAEGHIPGAVVISYTEIEARAAAELPDKHATILVYCRSGRRSKIAAEALFNMGYTDVREFGGIIDWPYDVVK